MLQYSLCQVFVWQYKQGKGMVNYPSKVTQCCESLHFTPVIYIILYINYALVNK